MTIACLLAITFVGENLASERARRNRIITQNAVDVIRHVLWARHEDDASLPPVPGNPLAGLWEAETYFAAGDPRAALDVLPDVDGLARWGPRATVLGMRARIHAALGSEDECAADFAEWRSGWYSRSVYFLLARTNVLGAIDDLVCRLGDEELCTDIRSYLARYPALRTFFAHAGSPDYLRGALALRLGDSDAAERHYSDGLAWAGKPDVRFGFIEGRCHQGLAEVAERRGQHVEAMQHLDAAGELFARHGAKLYLDQVLAKKEILRA
jgi:hypothetical protein